MARLGLGRKREEEEQVRQAMSEQEAAVVEGRDYAKNTAAAMQATKHHVVAEHPTNPFEQTAKKTDAQIIADYDAEMAARDGMAPGNPKADTGYNDISVDFSSIKSNEQAAYFASTLHDETTKAEFLKDWAKYSKQDSETGALRRGRSAGHAPVCAARQRDGEEQGEGSGPCQDARGRDAGTFGAEPDGV